MSKHVLNSEISLQTFIGSLRELWKARRYLEVSIKEGKGRTIEQNAVMYGWYGQVARELREDDEKRVRRFCKLHFGVPILRPADDEFREAYDRVIKPLAYGDRLAAMDILPVTSRMTTLQLHDYMTEMQNHYAKRGVTLEYPKERAA